MKTQQIKMDSDSQNTINIQKTGGVFAQAVVNAKQSATPVTQPAKSLLERRTDIKHKGATAIGGAFIMGGIGLVAGPTAPVWVPIVSGVGMALGFGKFIEKAMQYKDAK